MTLYWQYDKQADKIIYGYDYEGCYHGDFQIENVLQHKHPDMETLLDLGGATPESQDFVTILETGSILTQELRDSAVEVTDLESTDLFAPSKVCQDCTPYFFVVRTDCPTPDPECVHDAECDTRPCRQKANENGG